MISVVKNVHHNIYLWQYKDINYQISSLFYYTKGVHCKKKAPKTLFENLHSLKQTPTQSSLNSALLQTKKKTTHQCP